MMLSPDCRDGNHQKCTGDAWDLEADGITNCRCGCHDASQDIDTPLQAAMLQLAREIDHPMHHNDAEHEEVCDICNAGLMYGKQRWPCIHRRYAERIRSVIEQTRTLGS